MKHNRFTLWSVTKIMVLVLTGLFGSQVSASNCAIENYDHNGSVMEVVRCDGGTTAITYVQPRQGMVNVGVRNGTLLFEGIEEGSGVINGKARRFSRRCGENIYAVSGTDNGNRIVLRGNAPVLDRNCQVIRFKPDTLVFTLQQQQFQPPMNPPHQPPPQVGGAQDWYAIAGSFNSERQANQRARQLAGSWYVFNSRHCPNMRPGYWIAAMGPLPKRGAQSYADMARRFGAYIKRCN